MSTKRLVYIALFAALITVGGLISVPVPFTQVQMSLQTVFVISAGLLLGGRDGALATLIYIVMGLLGLPVFTSGGGLSYIFMPSFGYLVGFPIGALASGALNSRCRVYTRGRVFLCALIGMLPVYMIGATYQVLILYYYTGVSYVAAIGGLPALVGLLVKDGALLGFVSAFYPSLRRALPAVGERNKRLPDGNGQII